MKPQTLVRLGEGALNLALSIALIPLLGLAGVALSMPVAAALTSVWFLPRLANRLFPISGDVLLSSCRGTESPSYIPYTCGI